MTIEFNQRGQVQQKLIERGVLNLKEFGYVDVDVDNILTDAVYSAFFLSMLNENLGYGFDYEINEIIKTIKENKND